MRSDKIYRNVADQFAPEYALSALIDNRRHDHIDRDLSSRAVRDHWRALLKEERRGRRKPGELHCYVQVPFCEYRCAFCCFYSRIAAKRGDEIDRYLDFLTDELSYFAGTFQDRSLQTLHIGGGTPGILDPGRLERLLGTIFSRYTFGEKGEKAFEFTPDTVAAEKLRVLERFGVNRISMGVQSIHPEILSRESRPPQPAAVLERAVGAVKESGRFMLNVDLLLGMQGDDTASFLRTFDAVAALGPEQIIVYRIDPLHAYLKKFYTGSAQEYFAGVRERYRGLAEKIQALATRHSYEYKTPMSLENHTWDFMRRRRKAGRFSAYYNEVSAGPASVLGLGPAARSHIAGRLAYWQKTGTDGRFEPDEPIHRSRGLRWRDEMVKFMLLHVQHGRPIPAAEFRETFGRGLEAVFGGALRALTAAREITKSGDSIGVVAARKRERFLAGLRFVAPGRLKGHYISRQALVTGGKALPVRIKKLAPDERYAATAGGYGLQVLGDPTKSLSGESSFRLGKILRAAFLQAQAKKRRAGVPGIAREFRRETERILRRLHKRGRLREISARLREEA